MKTIVLILRLGLGAVLAYAGAVKALDPAAFATSLGNYQLFPAWLVAPLASGLPWLGIAYWNCKY